MKCQFLFSGKNMKSINLLSAELALRVGMVKVWALLNHVSRLILTLKVPITIATDDNFYFVFLQK